MVTRSVSRGSPNPLREISRLRYKLSQAAHRELHCIAERLLRNQDGSRSLKNAKIRLLARAARNLRLVNSEYSQIKKACERGMRYSG